MMSEEQEILSYQKHKEETWKTRVFRFLFWFLVLIAIILFLYWILATKFFGLPGLNVFNRFIRYMNIPMMIMIASCTIPFWWWVFDKFKLFIRGWLLDLTDIPIIGKIKPTSAKIDGKFFYDGDPCMVKYGKKYLDENHMKFACMLGEWKTAEKLMNIYKENILYSVLLKEYALIYNKEADDMLDDQSLKNIKERLIEGDVEDVIRSILVPEVKDDLQTKKE